MWNIISIILNILLGLGGFYLYLENKKLKRFEIDKNIKLKEIEIREQQEEYQNRLNDPVWSYNFKWRDYEREKTNIIDKLNAELEHLKKLKKYKWLFGKNK
jgi:predicted ATP-binding protein involved in virulence